MRITQDADYDSLIRTAQNSFHEGSIDLEFFESHIVSQDKRPNETRTFEPPQIHSVRNNSTNDNGKYFCVNLPHSNAVIKNKAVLSNSCIVQPVVTRRGRVESFIKPKMFDVVREQAKSKIRENLKFKKAEQDVRFAQLMHKSEIPEPILESHFEAYQEFPTTVDNKPTSRHPCTFGTAERFKQPPMQCTQEALHLSALDYNHLVERKRAPDFNGYDKRGDNFLTREQVADIRLQEEERKQRLARL